MHQLSWGSQEPRDPLPDTGLCQLVGDEVELGRLRGHQQPRDRGQHAGSDRQRHGWGSEAHARHLRHHR